MKKFENQVITKNEIFHIETLPEPSAMLMTILPLLQDREVDFSKLINAIQRDQVLVARMLKLINSSFYGVRGSVKNVSDAMTLLGVNNIKQIVFSTICFNLFNQDEESEWNHAYTTSLAVTNLIHRYSLPMDNNLQLLALVHDIGKVVFRRKFDEMYQILVDDAKQDHMPIFQRERERLSYDHTDVGAWLMEAWDMPDDIVSPIFYHHMEHLPEIFTLETATLCLADWIDNAARGNADYEYPSRQWLECLEVKQDDIEGLVERQKNIIANTEGGVLTEANVA